MNNQLSFLSQTQWQEGVVKRGMRERILLQLWKRTAEIFSWKLGEWMENLKKWTAIKKTDISDHLETQNLLCLTWMISLLTPGVWKRQEDGYEILKKAEQMKMGDIKEQRMKL